MLIPNQKWTCSIILPLIPDQSSVMCVRITLVEVFPKYLKIEELVEGVYNMQEIREWSRERKTGRVGSE